MRAKLSILALLMFSAWSVRAEEAFDPNFEMASMYGTYSVLGKASDGKLYCGVATIARKHGKWTITRRVNGKVSVEKAYFNNPFPNDNDMTILFSRISDTDKQRTVAYIVSTAFDHHVNLIGTFENGVGEDILTPIYKE